MIMQREYVNQDIFFNAIPGQVDPLSLRSRYQKKLLDSLKIYPLALSRSINVDLSLQIIKIDKVDFQYRFSPILYALYAQIKNAYEKKKLDELLDCIQLLNNESPENLYANHLQYGTTLSEAWERPFLQEIRERVPLDESIHPITGRLKILPLIHWSQNDFPPPIFHRSLNLLKTLDNFLFREVQAYVSRIKFYSSHTLHSVTSPRYFGAIYMRLPFIKEDQELFFLETIVHETSHLHLFAIMDLNIIILNDEYDLYASPLRIDKRPMIGVFHAVFVLSRMVRVLHRYTREI